MWEWFCYDDNQEDDLWSRWYHGSSDAAQARHDVVLSYLEPRNANEWREPYTKALDNGLVEVRIHDGQVQHRLIGFYGPERLQFTFLISCTHKQNVYAPPDALKTAAKRKKDIEDGAASVRKSKRPEKA